MSGFTPLQRNQMSFVGPEYFAGGEDGDGSELHGYPTRHREETSADPWGRMVPTPEDVLIAKVEERDADPWSLSESEGPAEVDGHPPVTVNGLPLETALADGLDSVSDVPDSLGLAEHWWIMDARCTGQAARAHDRFERDGITKIGSRLAAQLAGVFREQSTGPDDRTWKRYRPTQYRPRGMLSFAFFQLITGAN